MFTDTHVTSVETSHIQPHVIHEHIFSAHIQTHMDLAPRANRANRATRTLLREQIEQHRPCSATARCNDDLAPRNRGTPAGKAIQLWKMWIANNLLTKVVEPHSLHTSVQCIWSYFRIKIFCDMSPLNGQPLAVGWPFNYFPLNLLGTLLYI